VGQLRILAFGGGFAGKAASIYGRDWPFLQLISHFLIDLLPTLLEHEPLQLKIEGKMKVRGKTGRR